MNVSWKLYSVLIVRPCVSEKEFAVTKTKVQDFCRGVGPILQTKLEERASQSKNWVNLK
jgi:hypothetical protein